MTPRSTALALGSALVAVTGLTACSSDAAAESAVELTATNTACEVADTRLPGGPTTFAITNDGSKVTEVYVSGRSGGRFSRVVTEKENIGPGTSYDLTVSLEPGSYEVACKPGQTGDGIRTRLTVSGTGTPDPDPDADRAVAAYRGYVQQQADALVPLVDAFVAAVKAGDVAEAKRRYAGSRAPWEAIEPVAESFGDLDPRVDLREADLEPGQEWTGWHRLEKALWTDDAGLFFLAYQRDPRHAFLPIQTELARHDALNEYLRHTGSSVWAVPPGVGRRGWWGETLLG